jgi:predicted ATPase
MARRTDIARDRAEELVALAQRSGDETLFLEAIHCRWSTASFCGDVSRALADGREGIRHYDPDRHGQLAAAFGGHDPGVCAYVVLALSLAQAGNPREAASSIELGLTLAKRLNQPSTLVHAITNAIITYQIIGDRDAIRGFGSQMADIAGKFNLPLQRSIANFYLAWANAYGEHIQDGLQVMELEFARISHAVPLLQHFAALLASVRLESGHPIQAMELLDPILKTVQEPGVGFYLPEIHRLRGECLLRLDAAQFSEAAREFDTAIAIARQQQSHLLQLRSAISLTHLWTAKGAPENSRPALEEAIGVFDGSDDAPDLAPARKLLSASSC